MGVMKRIRTAMQQDPSLQFKIYSIKEAGAMRSFIKNHPLPLMSRKYDEGFMKLNLDYTGSLPADIESGENYIVIDISTQVQYFVWVFKNAQKKQYVLPIGETISRELSQYNFPTFRWLRVKRIELSDINRLRA